MISIKEHFFEVLVIFYVSNIGKIYVYLTKWRSHLKHK